VAEVGPAPPASSTPAPSIEKRIETERVRLFYRQTALAAFFTSLAAVLVAVMMWHDVANRTVLLAWLAGILIVQVARFLLVRSFGKIAETAFDARRWRRRAIAAAAAAGIGWGASAFVVFDPADPFDLMIMVATGAGVIAGGAAIMTAVPKAYFAYLFFHVSAMAWVIASAGGWVMLTFAASTLAYGALMVMITRIGSATVQDALRLRFERADMIEDLEAQRLRAESASQAKSEFLAMMTHELRTPLNSIIGYAELISTPPGGARPAKLDEYIRDIREGGHHLLSVINDILDLSKADAGKLELQESLFSVTNMMERCRRLTQPRAEEGKVVLELTSAEGLPAVRGDERLLRQALVNVIANAIKFSRPGGTVRIGASRSADGGLAIEVADAGIGMKPEDIPRALQPFQQIDHGLKRERSGSGLGLPLTKRFLDVHRGDVEIESRIGEGTTVRLLLPAHRIVQ